MSPEKPDALLWMDVETTGLESLHGNVCLLY